MTVVQFCLEKAKRSIQYLIDHLIVRPLQYIKFRVGETNNAPDTVFTIVWNRAMQTSADYVESKLGSALLFAKRQHLWDLALSKANKAGLFAEFGVYKGSSINYFAEKYKDRTFYGFDGFEGLKEDWEGTTWAKGAFDLGGRLPKVRANVKLVKGWFDETLPKFTKEHSETASFLHLDADTYDSTLLVLNLLKDRIKKGTIIVFDEYIGFPNWQNGEFLAWKNFVADQGIQYRYLGFSNLQAAVEVC